MHQIHTVERPDEFQLNVIGGNIVYAEWRDNIREVPAEDGGGFVADAYTVEAVSVPATTGQAKRLLMLCKYPDTSAECAILRRPVDDQDRIEHEAYHARVDAFIEGQD